MKRWVIAFITLLIIAYPFAVYFGLNYFSPRYIALGLILIFFLRFILIAPNIKSHAKFTLIAITVAGIVVSILGIIFNQNIMIKLYPVVMNLLMFGIFFYSLLYPPTIIEKLARIKTPDLPKAAEEYTRKVTIAWCVFFVVNGLVALWTALFSTLKIWTFYNGFLSYILIGVMFVAEFIYRQWAKRKNRL